MEDYMRENPLFFGLVVILVIGVIIAYNMLGGLPASTHDDYDTDSSDWD